MRIKCHKFCAQTRPRILGLCNERSSAPGWTAFGKHSHRRKKGGLGGQVFMPWVAGGFSASPPKAKGQNWGRLWADSRPVCD